MKKAIIGIFAAMFLFSFKSATENAEKEYTVKFKEGQINILYNTLQIAKQAIPRSDMPVKDAIQVLTAIDSVSKVIATQYQAQMEPVKK